MKGILEMAVPDARQDENATRVVDQHTSTGKVRGRQSISMACARHQLHR